MRQKLLIFFLIIAGVFYALWVHRITFLQPPDLSYSRDLYDHSQWRLATGLRSISDETLYQVAGVDQMKTRELFTIAPEVPPLGKYIYGVFTIFFGNPYYATIPFFLLASALLYLLSTKLLPAKKYRYIALLLFVLDPLVISQLWQTMMDLPQLTFLLLHILSIFYLLESKGNEKRNLLFSVIAGLSLGCFISLKIGFLAVFILIPDIFYLWKNKKLVWFIPLILAMGVPFVLSYTVFFLKGNGIKQFLRAQKWVLTFYFTSRAHPVRLAVPFSLLLGIIKGWDQKDTWHRFMEWTISWPLITIASFYSFLKFFKSKKANFDNNSYPLFVCISLLLSFLLVPFFARYLLLVLPIFYIYALREFKFIIEKKPKLFVGLLLIVLLQFFLFLNPVPKTALSGLENLWQKGLYQDIFSSFNPKTVSNFSRDTFWRYMQANEKNMNVTSREVHISYPFTFPWEIQKKGYFEIIYSTPIGEIHNGQPIVFEKINNEWKIDWKPSLVVNGFTSSSMIKSDREVGHYGKVISPMGTVLADEQFWPFFSVIPDKVKDEQKMQNQLVELTGLKKNELELLYKANNQPDWPADIAFLKKNFSPSTLDNQTLDPSINIEKRKTLVYHPIKGYSFESINQAVENNHNRLFPISGGSIDLLNQNIPNTKILEKKPQDGTNLYLE